MATERWTSLVQRNLPWIVRQARGRVPLRLRAKFDTDDVVQDAAVRALAARPFRTQPNEGQLRAWLGAVVRSSLLDAIARFTTLRRSAGREVALSEAPVLYDEADSPSATVQRREHASAVWDALAGLDAADRYLVEAHDCAGKSFAALAAETGLSKSEVRRRYVAAFQRLVRSVNELPGAGGGAQR